MRCPSRFNTGNIVSVVSVVIGNHGSSVGISSKQITTFLTQLAIY